MSKKLLLQEAAAWRLIARTLGNGRTLYGRGPGYLCDEVNRLAGRFGGDASRISEATRTAMLDRTHGYLGNAWSAFEDDLDDYGDCGEYPRRKEAMAARCLASLWLSCEADDEARGSRE